MLRRIHVEPDHISGLRLEVRIVRRHVPAHAMRLESRPRPDARDHHVTGGTEMPRQLARRPVGRAVRWGTSCPVQNPSLKPRGLFLNGSTLMSREEPGQAFVEKPTLPPGDEGRVAPERRLDRRIGRALGQHKDKPRTPDVVRPQFPRTHAGLQLLTLGRTEHQQVGVAAHAPAYADSTCTFNVTVH